MIAFARQMRQARVESAEVGMANDFKYDVFLSHNKADKLRVRRLAERLRGAGLRVWFDEWVIKPGDSIFLAVERGLESARTLILCMSPKAFQSKWVDLERGTVLFRDPSNVKRRFIPLMLAKCKIPDALRHYRYVDYRKETNEAFQELFQSVGKTFAAEICSRFSSSTEFLQTVNLSEDCIQPLHRSEDRFLQVLLSEFSLHRHRGKRGMRFELQVAFDDGTPTIWNREGKQHLLGTLPEERRAKYQTRLDDFLSHGRGADNYFFNDPAFVFRFASCGTLPIIRFGSSQERRDYYCLFLRDAYPVGWNIANGSCDTRAELLNPEEALERELREELVIADFENDKRYLFPSDTRKPVDHPMHAVARRLWARKCPDKDVSALNTEGVKMRWIEGPDLLRIRIGVDKPVQRAGFFLNINGDDFGIEFDKIARVQLPGSVTLFDGEIDEGELVNRPVGLFSVDRFNRQLRSGKKRFTPEIVFYGAERYDGRLLDYIVKHAFIPHIERFRGPESVKLLKEKIKTGKQYDLCPVTRRIVERLRCCRLPRYRG
ncbi:MAG: toll/interleukin-1 receptor domain-containing protein [Verrucomicrobiota bacterium]